MPVTIARVFEPVEVDLWGEAFRTVEITRSVQSKIDEYERSVEALNEDSGPDDLVAILAEMLDARLKPAEGSRKASTAIKAKWKADELALDRLLEFVGELADAGRPT